MLIKRITIELARVLLSFTLLLSSFLKAIDPIGLSIKIEEYLEAIAHIHISNSNLLLFLSIVLISFEFLLGSCLAMGIYRRLSARLSFLFMLAMTALTAYNFFFEAVSDCGCFGDAIKLSNGATLLKNLLLLPLSYFVMKVARKIKPLYTIRERLLLLVLSLGCMLFFIRGNVSQLPLIDFRPYKVGYNLNERIQEEQELLQKELLKHTKYIYSKDGEEKAFSPNALPDSSWTFVSMKQDLDESLKPKYNFHLLDSLGVEQEKKILNSKNLSFLLLAPSWDEAPLDKVDEINYLHYLAKERGINFYAISASDATEGENWLYETGADYPLLSMDKTTIKTIIRSPLGLVLIKNGLIIDKLSYQELPKRTELTSFIEKYSKTEQILPKSKSFRLIPLIIWLIFVIFGFGRRLLRHSLAFSYLRKR